MPNFFDQFDAPAQSDALPMGPNGIPRIQMGNPSPRYNDAISSIESGGRYDLLGPVTRTGDRALGKYQVMSSNVGPWSKEVFGEAVTPQEFLQNPQLQDALFNAKFGSYVDKYGPEGAAKAWFAGEKGMNNPNARDQLGTSVAGYARRFMAGLGPSQANASEVQQPQSQPTPAKGNYFDQFDAPQGGNPFDRFDVPKSPQPSQPASPLPILGYPETYRQVREDAQNQLGTGISQLRHAFDPAQPGSGEGALEALKGAGNTALGAAGYVASPLTAAVRNVISQPIQNLTGIPKEYTEFAANLALPGVGMTKLGSTRVPILPPSSPGQDAAAAAGRLSQSGSPVTVPRFIASDSPSVQYAAQGVRNVPVGGSPIVQATDRSLSQLGTKADELASNYGGSSVHNAGASARQSIVDWIGPESKANVSKAYDAVDHAVNPNVTTELTNTRSVAQDILSRRANAGIQGESGAVTKIAEAATRPGGLNYAGIKDLRTNLGEALSNNILPEGMSAGEAKQLYGALSKDLGVAVNNAGGPRASALFERANKYNALVNDRREALAKVVGADGNAPAEQVFDRIVGMASGSSRADITRLAQARKAMDPSEWNDVASAVTSRLGRDAEGNFSPARFVTDYGKLSDSGKSILFRSAGKSNLADSLDDIATISSRWKDNYQKFGNPSGTAQNLSFAAAGVGMAPLLTGHLVEPITTISTVVGARVMASVLSQPATAASAAQFARRYQVAAQSPNPAAVANLTIAAKNLASTINSNLGLGTNADDFLRAIQGAVPARPEDKQPSPVGVGNQ